MNKTQQYEQYKQYLRSLNLTSVEYEKRIREWWRKHKFWGWQKYNGKTQTVSQWANELGVEPDSIFSRLQKGFTEEEALSLKVYERRKRC